MFRVIKSRFTGSTYQRWRVFGEPSRTIISISKSRLFGQGTISRHPLAFGSRAYLCGGGNEAFVNSGARREIKLN